MQGVLRIYGSVGFGQTNHFLFGPINDLYRPDDIVWTIYISDLYHKNVKAINDLYRWTISSGRFKSSDDLYHKNHFISYTIHIMIFLIFFRLVLKRPILQLYGPRSGHATLQGLFRPIMVLDHNFGHKSTRVCK